MKIEKIIAEPVLGNGIYTIPDIATLLRLPNYKVNRWIKTFWDDKLGAKFKQRYSWDIGFTRAINFHTLIEIYTFYQLTQAGVKPSEILKAHEWLSEKENTPYPFAKKDVLQRLRSDGKKVLWEDNEGIRSVDKSAQFYLEIIKPFLKNLDFDNGQLAVRLWPLGKERSIVCDPHHKFGQPVINGTNITADVISDMNRAGDSVEFIAKAYNISPKQVQDAVDYGAKAA